MLQDDDDDDDDVNLEKLGALDHSIRGKRVVGWVQKGS